MSSSKELVLSQFYELIKFYPDLSLSWDNENGIIEGKIAFNAIFNDVQIEDSYSIRIEVTKYYPFILPITFETGNRIPSDYHKMANNCLCLGVVSELYLKFSNEATLLFYINKFVVEYLYSFSYREKHGEIPYGERSHNSRGILEFFQEYFETKNPNALMYIAESISIKDKYRGHHQCYCGSGKRIRDCHGHKILEFKMNLDKFYVSHDVKELIDLLHKSGLVRR